MRPVDWRWSPEQDGAADAAGGRVDGLHALAEAMCQGRAKGLSIAPKSGVAQTVNATIQ